MTNTMTTATTTNTVESFADAKSLVADMQSFNSFRVSHIKPADSFISSIVASKVYLGKYDYLEFERDFTYGINSNVKSATKTVTGDTAVYKIDRKDGWNKYGTHDEESKWLTDDFITVEAWNKEKSDKPCTIEQFDMYSLINPKYFDAKRSGNGLIVIDIDKLGVMTDKQKKDFNYLMKQDISHYCYGEYQTVCYNVEADDDLFRIGLYSLDSEKILERYLIIPDEIDEWDNAHRLTVVLKEYDKKVVE